MKSISQVARVEDCPETLEEARVLLAQQSASIKAQWQRNKEISAQLAAVTKERDELKEDNDYRRTEMGNVWEMVQKISPWQESNDMNWSDEISCGLYGIAEQLTAALARAEKAEEALRPLAAIADAWDANKLDDEARKHYGVNLEFTNMKHHDEIELYTGRGGKRLLTLADCLAARAALTPTKESTP